MLNFYATLCSRIKQGTYVESSLPNETGIDGPPHSETASAPATAIMSAQDTNNGNIQNMLVQPIRSKTSSNCISQDKDLVVLHPPHSLLSLQPKQ